MILRSILGSAPLFSGYRACVWASISHCVKIAVNAFLLDKLLMTADIYNLTLFHHDDAVGIVNSGKAVGNDQ